MKSKFFIFFIFILISKTYADVNEFSFINPQILADNKNAYANGSVEAKHRVSELLKLADKYLTAKPQSVMDKNFTPTSGTKHDYMSMGPYWWPDTTKKDGLPYIRKDGIRNPEIKKISDRDYMGSLETKCKVLALAYYFTGNENYAQKAVDILKVWFLNDNTKMNPNLNFAQAIPGRNDGRGIGIIESRFLADLTDWILMLKDSKSLSKNDYDGLQSWYKNFLTWMRTSKNGKDEHNAKNNHGTFYDYQVSVFAVFTGQKDLAKSILAETKKRIDLQIEKDGKQPLELERTNAYSYSTMNLEGWFKIALASERLGINLWDYQNNGRNLRKALDYLAPYALGEEKLIYEQLIDYSKKNMEFLMIIAADKFKEPMYLQEYKKAAGVSFDLYNALLYTKLK